MYKKSGFVKGKKKVFRKKVVKKKSGPLRLIPRPNPVELKYMDSEATNSTLATTGNRYLLNGNVQGTSTSTRIGNKVTIKHIELKMNYTSTVVSSIKMAIVYDKQANAALAAVSDIYNAIGGIFYPWATRNSVNSQRFVILKNFVMTINPNITATLTSKQLSKYIKCNIPVQYNGGVAGTIADIQTGAIYMVVLCDNANSSLSYTSRLRFQDD